MSPHEPPESAARLPGCLAARLPGWLGWPLEEAVGQRLLLQQVRYPQPDLHRRQIYIILYDMILYYIIFYPSIVYYSISYYSVV